MLLQLCHFYLLSTSNLTNPNPSSLEQDGPLPLARGPWPGPERKAADLEDRLCRTFGSRGPRGVRSLHRHASWGHDHSHTGPRSAACGRASVGSSLAKYAGSAVTLSCTGASGVRVCSSVSAKFCFQPKRLAVFLRSFFDLLSQAFGRQSLKRTRSRDFLMLRSWPNVVPRLLTQADVSRLRLGHARDGNISSFHPCCTSIAQVPYELPDHLPQTTWTWPPGSRPGPSPAWP